MMGQEKQSRLDYDNWVRAMPDTIKRDLVWNFPLFLTLAGFALRLHYLTTTHPFFDEYITGLAARQTWHQGWPVLPSGLFYEHGLLATYLSAPFTALFINIPLDYWQPAHWRLMLTRWPSLLVSTATIPLIYIIGRRTLGRPAPALVAVGLFAFSPEGMVWGGRARMYALATLFVLLTVYYAYRGLTKPSYCWLALLCLAISLMTQFGVLMILPPVFGAMLLLSTVRNSRFSRSPLKRRLQTYGWQIVTLALIIGAAIWLKRLGQPLGTPELTQTGNLLTELIFTIAYQTTFHFTWPDTVDFLARQFGRPHLFGLTSVLMIGLLVSLTVRLIDIARRPIGNFTLFLLIIWSLLILQTVTLLEPFRRNPRYLVMYLPLLYLLAAQLVYWPGEQLGHQWPRLARFGRPLYYLLAGLLIWFNVSELRLALQTPEPAYEEAFALVHDNWQPGDALLTMNTPAAGLYLGHVEGFTVESQADQFLLDRPTGPVDRWWGAPWLGTASDFNAALNTYHRVWFVSDTIRQPVYFRGSWQAIINSQMELVLATDNVLVYHTKADRRPLPSQPAITLQANLDQLIQLTGYSQQLTDGQLHLTLFWQALTSPAIDYTVFVHVRNAAGETVAQQDSQPVGGNYPTSHWQAGETIIDPVTLNLPAELPPGQYKLVVGLYRLDTLARLPVINDRSGENAIILGTFPLTP